MDAAENSNAGKMSMTTGDFYGRDHTKEVDTKDYPGAHFIWLEEVSAELIIGELRHFAEVAGAYSTRIPAYGYGDWGPGEVPLAKDGEKVVLNLHGGGYVMGTAHPSAGHISYTLLKHGDSAFRVLSVDYRLSTADPYPPSAPFPTALIDALAGYVYLTRQLGFKPQNVVLCGDSAGGNLALALARYLRDNPSLGLGMPGGLVLLSPWADLAGTYMDVTGAPNMKCDYSKPPTDDNVMGLYTLRAFLGKISLQDACQNLYIVPASQTISQDQLVGAFAGFPPTYIVGGGAEVFIDSIRTLRLRMENDMPKGTVVYDEVEDAIHDFVCFPTWQPEQNDTLKRTAYWVREL